MFYFKRVKIDYASGQKVEKSVREFSAKRHTSLDWQSSQHEPYTQKVFLGHEGENKLRITRIRSFDRLLPQLILLFEKENQFTEYRIRYSLLSTIVGVFLVAATISTVVRSVMNRELDEAIGVQATALGIFFLLTIVEIRITQKRLAGVIAKKTYQ